MDDLYLVENFESLIGGKLYLCGRDFKKAKLLRWLTGGPWEVVVLSGADMLSQVEDHPNQWVFLPGDSSLPMMLAKMGGGELLEKNGPTGAIPNPTGREDWMGQAARLKAEKCPGLHVCTMMALDQAIILQRRNPALPEEYRKHLAKCVNQEFMAVMPHVLKLTEELVLQDDMCQEIEKENPVLAYSSPKTGGMTIYASLQAAGLPARHIHALRGEKLIRTMQNMSRPVRIITGIREPLDREVSLTFQVQGLNMYGDKNQGLKADAKTMIESNRKFNKTFLRSDATPYGAAFSWFDKELKENFGIDVFSQPFDREKGYGIYKNGNIHVFLYRLENLNGLEKELADFLGRPDFRLVSANADADKDEKYLYQEFKKKFRFPEAYVRLHYEDNPRMDHFYTREEQQEFLKKWSAQI